MGSTVHGVPRVGRLSVDRRRLVRLLDRIHETGILLVSAGAGFGKTTALSSWVSGLDDVAVAWVNCGEEHNDPRYLADELATALHEAIGGAPIATIGDIADAVGASDDVVVVVFDDAHQLTNPSVWSAVDDLLRRRPDNLRIVVSGRDEEGLPWHRLRPMGEVSEVRGRDLCFTPAETAALLTQTYGIEDPDRLLDELLAATDGWATGVCLAGHSLRHGATDAIDRLVLARHRDVRRYFDDELLNELTDDHVRFLEVTCVLERLDPELCDLLTDRSDSHEVLEFFVDHNLFTEQVSVRPPVFRYHQLFNEYLRTRASRRDPATVAGQLALASRWYEAHDVPDLAIEAAVRSGDVGRVEELVRAVSGRTLRAGFPHTVARWLSALPQESLDANPDLALLLARSAGATGHLLAVNAGLAAVDPHIEDTTTPAPPSLRFAYRGLVLMNAIWTGDFDTANEELSRSEAIAAEHHDDLGYDMFGLDPADLGAYRAALDMLRGDFDAAMDQVERILTPGQLMHPVKDATLAIGVRALAMAWRGEHAAAKEAVEQCRVALSEFAGRTGGVLAFLVAGAWCADLDAASSDVARARVLVSEAPLPVYRALYFLAEARFALRTRRWDAAAASLDEAHALIGTMRSSGVLPAIESDLRAELAGAASDAVELDFTDRELAVLRKIAAGATRREAAAELYLSVNTVKTYLRSSYHKLGATSREEAVERASARGLLGSSSS